MTLFNHEAYAARRAAEKAEWRAKRTQPHGWNVGQILVRSWGYDQTNIDYYEVTAVHGQRVVTIRKIASKLIENQTSQNLVTADPGKYIGEPKRCTVNYGRAKVDDYKGANAYPWDGKPDHETAAGWGH